MKNSLSLLLLLLLSACVQPTQERDKLDRATLEARLNALSEKAVRGVAEIPLDSNKIPRAVNADGTLHSSTSRDWTSGFYVGTLWELFQETGDPKLKTAAEQWTAFQEKEKWDTHTHDLGFKIYCSYGQAWEVEPKKEYADVIIQASETLIKRFNSNVGAIRSWDFNKEIWQFPVIIDNMMNLEMLFAATRLSGDSTYYKAAYQHAQTTLENHYRSDNSSYHVIDYDTLSGAVRNRHTHQGVAHESAWARGQAWGLYGFSMVYRETGAPQFLEKAKDIVEFFFQHPNLPEDLVPYWDFNAREIPDDYRDASAAAIAAAGLLELYHLDEENQAQYLDWADRILQTLAKDEYQAKTAPFLLRKSVGNLPSGSEIDVPIVYADYFYVEALQKRLAIEKNRLKL